MRRVSEKSLMNAALFYLRRYVPSEKQLERVLLRKCRRVLREKGQRDAERKLTSESGGELESKPDLKAELEAAKPLVQQVLARLTALGYLDDARLAESKARSLRRGGASSRAIAQKLVQKGLARSLASVHSRATAEEETAAAWALAKRKRLGPYSRVPMDAVVRRRQLAAMVRGGFPYALARAVVDARAPHPTD